MNSTNTVDIENIYRPPFIHGSGDWEVKTESEEPTQISSEEIPVLFYRIVGSTVTILPEDKWLIDPHKEVSATAEARKPLLISDLGWTPENAFEVRARLASFESEWDDPNMDIYNEY